MKLLLYLVISLTFLSCGNEDSSPDDQSSDEDELKSDVVGNWSQCYVKYQDGFIDTSENYVIWKFTEDSIFMLNGLNCVEFSDSYETRGKDLIFSDPIANHTYSYQMKGDTLIITEGFRVSSFDEIHYFVPTTIAGNEIDRLIFNRIDWNAFDTTWICEDQIPKDADAIMGLHMNYIDGVPYILDMRPCNRQNWRFDRDTLFLSDKNGWHKALLVSARLNDNPWHDKSRIELRFLDNEDFNGTDYFVYEMIHPDSVKYWFK
jgi:hypothetical protein